MKPINPSPYNKNRASCEVCWADSEETNIYHYQGTTYCEQDLQRAKDEGWARLEERIKNEFPN